MNNVLVEFSGSPVFDGLIVACRRELSDFLFFRFCCFSFLACVQEEYREAKCFGLISFDSRSGFVLIYLLTFIAKWFCKCPRSGYVANDFRVSTIAGDFASFVLAGGHFVFRRVWFCRHEK